MIDKALIQQYLLGNLPQEQRGRIEDQYFAEIDTFEELLAVENDLIDSYVRGQLSPSEKEQFETQYLSSPQQVARVEFARSLDRACREFSANLHESKSPTRTFGLRLFSRSYRTLQWASLVAALVLAFGGLWLILQKHQLRIQLQEAQRRRQASPIQVEPQVQQPHAPGPTIAVRDAGQSQSGPENNTIGTLSLPRKPTLTFTPASGAARGAEGSHKDLIIPSNISFVIFRLPISVDTYEKYQAEMETAEGRNIQTTDGLKSRKSDGQSVVLFRVPSERLAPGDYIVRLTGTDGAGRVEDVIAYSFRTVRK